MIKLFILCLLLLTSQSCVTKVQIIEVYNINGIQGVTMEDLTQKGSEDALNGNEATAKVK